jgi:hypothetical protein
MIHALAAAVKSSKNAVGNEGEALVLIHTGAFFSYLKTRRFKKMNKLLYDRCDKKIIVVKVK